MTRKTVVSDSTTPRADAIPKVTCIIPAYDEEKRIARVLRVVESHPWISEIIVVVEGTDNTAAVARTFKRVKLLDLGDKRLGKSYAVMKGLEVARHDVIMMLDADLLGLTHGNLSALMLPVLNGEVDVTMSLRRNSLLIFRLIGVDFVSGERVFRKEVLGDCRRLANHPGYGLEVFFNQEIIDHKRRMLAVYWRNVRAVRVEEKYGFFYGLWLEWAHFREGYATLTVRTFLHQLWSLRASSTRSHKRIIAGRSRQLKVERGIGLTTQLPQLR
ncbi:MAG: glycosyltransferase [Spirochaetia bacterium]|jgi:glycosyltransferase involved in cell wall biosynthesis